MVELNYKNMRYKLLKDLPNVKAGAIIDKFRINDYGQNIFSIKGHIFNEEDMRHNPDWFAPYLFTTEDGVDIFKGDTVWRYYTKDKSVGWTIADKGEIWYQKVINFSTKEKAEQYLDSLGTQYGVILKKNHKWDLHKIITYPKGFIQDFYMDIDLVTDNYIKLFNSYEEAEKYRDSLKPKFKVGDIVYCELLNNIYIVKSIIGNNTIDIGVQYVDIKYLRHCTNDEIIKYYEQQGWVKGAKFRVIKGSYNHIRTIKRDLYVSIDNSVIVPSDLGYEDISNISHCNNIEDCELVKEPNYPKSLEDIKSHMLETNYSTDFCRSIVTAIPEQYQSLIAFSLLTVLHKAMIDKYNRINNCDWYPDWNDGNTEKYSIIRLCSYLDVSDYINIYNPLAFPEKSMAEFSLKHHENLWKQYYEL